MGTAHDDKLSRCPKLGDEVPFRYCLQESGNLPCTRIITCWQRAFDVEATLRFLLTPQQWNEFIAAKPSDKIVTLIELIENAKRRT